MDTSHQKFNDIVQLACEICQTPMAFIALHGERKAQIGPDPDKQNIRFSEKAALIAEDGEDLGELVVLDAVPRMLSKQQKRMLELLAHQVVILVELDKAVTDADTDKLTCVSNRRYFEKEVAKVISSHQQTGSIFYLLLFDLDNFKAINDEYGHVVGDFLLTLFSKRITMHLKPSDIISRFGGDEFVVLVQHVSSQEDASQVAGRILKACQEPYVIDGKKIHCSASVGGASYPLAGTTIGTLFLHADFALYLAKRNHQSMVFYTHEEQLQFEERSTLEEHLMLAFESREFYTVYQPIIDTRGDKLYGLEVLLRWNMAGHGDVSPSIFVPLIEKMGLAETLNLYVVSEGIKEIKRIEKASANPIKISMNISPKILNLEAHFEKLIELVEDAGFDKNKIQIGFEITESSFLSSGQIPAEKLKKHHISLNIDDFGVQYSSMSRLLEHQFDMVKIDRSFVQKLDHADSAGAKAVIKAIKALGTDLGFGLIAEGAETRAQVEVLQGLGCPLIQGFYFSNPLSIAEVLKIIR